jgi:hypothetical protein
LITHGLLHDVKARQDPSPFVAGQVARCLAKNGLFFVSNESALTSYKKNKKVFYFNTICFTFVAAVHTVVSPTVHETAGYVFYIASQQTP